MSKIKYLRALKNPTSLPALTIEVVPAKKVSGHLWWKKEVLGYVVVIVRVKWSYTPLGFQFNSSDGKRDQVWDVLCFTQDKHKAYSMVEYEQAILHRSIEGI